MKASMLKGIASEETGRAISLHRPEEPIEDLNALEANGIVLRG